MRHGNLHHFFAIPKYAKLGFSTQNLSPTYQAHVAALTGKSIISHHFLLSERKAAQNYAVSESHRIPSLMGLLTPVFPDNLFYCKNAIMGIPG
jgi:hypothetical protein